MVQKPKALSNSRCRRMNTRKSIGEGLRARYMKTCQKASLTLCETERQDDFNFNALGCRLVRPQHICR